MIVARASVIDEIHFYYRCPTCGEQHFHGSDRNLDNRTEIRIGHCKKIEGNRMIAIVIDDTTIRKPLTQRQRRFLR